MMGFSASLYAQTTRPKIYLIHGQGSDTRLFSKLKLDSDFDTIQLSLPLPDRKDDMASYARKVALQIDTTNPFILIGVSLGGMVATELNDMIHPLQTIIISSAKNNLELPKRYRFMRKVPLYQLFPAGFIKISSYAAQPIVEPDRKKEKKIFKSMLHNKDKRFLKRSIPLIMKWKRTENSGKAIIHIHGTKDHTIPIKNIKNPVIITGGSHMMVLTLPEQISLQINHILQGLK